MYRRGIWLGWEAQHDDSSGVVVRIWPATKKRGVVVLNLTAAFAAGATCRTPLEEAS